MNWSCQWDPIWSFGSFEPIGYKITEVVDGETKMRYEWIDKHGKVAETKINEEERARAGWEAISRVFLEWFAKHDHIQIVTKPTSLPPPSKPASDPVSEWITVTGAKPHTWITLKSPAVAEKYEIKGLGARELPRCECGAGACGSNFHSDWCPLA